MWRYAILPVRNKICRKLLFNNLSIVWNVKILLITFCQEGPQMLCLVKNGRQKWPISRDSAQSTESVDTVFECTIKYMRVTSKNALPLIKAPPSGGHS